MSRTSTHDLYEAIEQQISDLQGSLSKLRTADGGRFKWETDEASRLIAHAKRYLGKPGEVLYCNWHDCINADDGGKFGEDRDLVGRALSPDEGVQFFKGRIHRDCAEEKARRENR